MGINEYDVSYQRYLAARHKYDTSNVVSKLVTVITGKVPKAPEPLRFAIKYSSIGMPFKKIIYHDGHSYAPDWEEHKVDPIVDDSEDCIDDLWTVVEYDGGDIFTDLVTGQRFRISIREGEIKELMDLYDRSLQFDRDRKMPELNDKVQKKYESYVEIPLAIGNERSLVSLDVDIKESILDNTVPQREKIANRLAKKEEIAREAIITRYKSDVDAFSEKARRARENVEKEERKKAEREEETRRKIEEAERKRELAKMREEEKDRVISPKFDEMFGPRIKK